MRTGATVRPAASRTTSAGTSARTSAGTNARTFAGSRAARVPGGQRTVTGPEGSAGRGDLVLAGLVVAGLACICLALASALGLLWTPSVRPVVAAPAPVAVPAASVPAPASLTVPAIDLDVPLGRLTLDDAGAVRPPARPSDAGWVEVSARPGRPGPAVLAGHLDSRVGPAVFARLGELRPGDRVEVEMDDGSRVAYVVRRTEQHPKDAFPTEAVYGASPVPTLRLVTCGGTVDPRTGHYRDNVVVYADLET